MTKSQVREKSVYLADTSKLIFIIKGSQDRNINRQDPGGVGADTNAVEKCCLLAYFKCLVQLPFYIMQNHQHMDGTTLNGLGRPPLNSN